MWATCCNWFCLDGQPEEVPPPQGARMQAYSNPGYSSFPSPTGLEPSCKSCGAHFASTARKVSADFLACSATAAYGPWASTADPSECLQPCLSLCNASDPDLSLSQKCLRRTNQVKAKAKHVGIDLESVDLNSVISFAAY